MKTAKEIHDLIQKEREERRIQKVNEALSFLDAESEKMFEERQTSRVLHKSIEGPLTGILDEPEVQDWIRQSGFVIITHPIQNYSDLGFVLMIP